MARSAFRSSSILSTFIMVEAQYHARKCPSSSQGLGIGVWIPFFYLHTKFAQAIAAHESSSTTKLSDRLQEEISLMKWNGHCLSIQM